MPSMWVGTHRIGCRPLASGLVDLSDLQHPLGRRRVRIADEEGGQSTLSPSFDDNLNVCVCPRGFASLSKPNQAVGARASGLRDVELRFPPRIQLHDEGFYGLAVDGIPD